MRGEGLAAMNVSGALTRRLERDLGFDPEVNIVLMLQLSVCYNFWEATAPAHE